jgi:cystathionine gamma-lyase
MPQDPQTPSQSNLSPTTLIHGGDQHGTEHGEVMPSICVSTTFRQSTPGVPIGAYDYTRAGNPTRAAFEQALAACESGQYCYAFSSGMAAMSTVLCLLKTGDRVVAIDDVYGGVDRLMRRVAVPQWGLEYRQCSMMDLDELSREIVAVGRGMVWLETPTNPTLKVVDIRQIVERVKAVNKDYLVVVDNTFATPILQQPLTHNADLVLHSVTKYIGGHSDVLMGAVVTADKALADRLYFLQKAMGAVPSPFDCFMALRGLKTLHVRMRQHCQSALAIAKFLQSHPHVESVMYPGLPSSPFHPVATHQMHGGFGGIVSFTLKNASLSHSTRLSTSLNLITLAESLGGVESLIDVPAVMTHASVPVEQRARLGITDALLRLSVGLEAVEDLVADLDQAIRAAFEAS